MSHPGALLQDRFLSPLGITAYRLAQGLGVQQTRISQILNGKRRISADTAVRLGAYFQVSPVLFLQWQMNHDLDRAKRAVEEVSPFEGHITYAEAGARRELEEVESPGGLRGLVGRKP